jgi:hypothetical protein
MHQENTCLRIPLAAARDPRSRCLGNSLATRSLRDDRYTRNEQYTRNKLNRMATEELQ